MFVYVTKNFPLHVAIELSHISQQHLRMTIEINLIDLHECQGRVLLFLLILSLGCH